MRRSSLENILIAGLLGVSSTVGSAWTAALLVDLDKPNEIVFQTALLEGDHAINVLRSDYDGAEVIAMRICDEQSVPRRVSKGEFELIQQMYCDFRDIKILPVVEQHSDLELPRWSGAHNWVDLILEAEGLPESNSDRYCVEQRFGWPWPVMYTTFCPTLGFTAWESTSGVRWESLDDRSAVDPAFLPKERLIPILPSGGPFALSALMFGGVWFVIVSACRAIPIAIRLKRGRCPMCGYDLRHKPEDGCPECGWNRRERGPQ